MNRNIEIKKDCVPGLMKTVRTTANSALRASTIKCMDEIIFLLISQYFWLTKISTTNIDNQFRGM